MNEWTIEQEAANLRRLLSTVKNKAEFAKRWNVPGGASMLSQHQSAHRPIGLDAAIAYAKGLGVPLDQISPRLAKKVAGLPTLIDSPSGNLPATMGPSPPPLPQSLEVIAAALRQSDDLVRDQASPLLAHLVKTPERAPEIIPRLSALLDHQTTFA